MTRASDSGRLVDGLLGGALAPLPAIHARPVHREPWPEFEAFDAAAYPAPLRREAAVQWIRRAREEHGSVLEFSRLLNVLCTVGTRVEVLGGLGRLITDEVRHVELCARMAVACWPEGAREGAPELEWGAARMPYDAPPEPAEDPRGEGRLRWAVDALLTSCCIGETLSLPLFEAAAVVTTDPVCEGVLRQILRDEHLHSSFGWAALEELLQRLDEGSRAWLQDRLAERLGGFEATCACGIALSELVDTELCIAPGSPSEPNLSVLTPRQFAMVFYATLEQEILPRFEALGLDAQAAWRDRHRGA